MLLNDLFPLIRIDLLGYSSLTYYFETMNFFTFIIKRMQKLMGGANNKYLCNLHPE